jgi:hypothetical protein
MAVPPAAYSVGNAASLAYRTSAEKFWYVLQCIYFGAGYLAKIPVKAALRDAGKCELTGAESFWYLLECLLFGAGYMHKVIVKKAFSEAGLITP